MVRAYRELAKLGLNGMVVLTTGLGYLVALSTLGIEGACNHVHHYGQDQQAGCPPLHRPNVVHRPFLRSPSLKHGVV
ncbi:MAG: hypothetical protein GY773_14640 [Actinomycetia bacterium]|nr:hypothetical protein [Actinomycetes bacterium]